MTLADAYTASPTFAGRTLRITVTDPQNGLTVPPGKIVQLRVTDEPQNGYGMSGADTVFVFYPGGAVVEQFENLSDPLGANIAIPLDYIGPFEVVAIGMRDDRKLVSSPPVRLNVVPAVATPPATVVAVRTEPTQLTLSGRGASERIRVIGAFSDGYEREVTGLALGTTYPPASSTVSITADGVVVAVAPGTTTLQITNNGRTVNVPTTVLDGATINNAPHADAGASYTACDGQSVHLNGSASYDIDVALGDVLTYTWDLDADGEFDDATGATPLVELRFPGECWLLGLRVADAAGLESTDYAYLEPAPGCLDGDFICSFTRAGATVGGLGTDASGNVYVGEYSSGGAFQNRVVKFSSSCGSLMTVDVPVRPEGMVVSSSGVIYIPNGNRILRHASNGSQMSDIPLGSFSIQPRIAVDAAGQICAVGFQGGNEVIRKFGATGSLITTWSAPFTGGVAVGPDESIYVFGQDQIARGVLQGGTYALDWTKGATGADAGMFDRISGIAVGPSNDLYVTDQGNHRVQRFRSDGTFVRMYVGSGDPAGGGGFRDPGVLCVGASEHLIVADNTIGDPRVQAMGAVDRSLPRKP